MLFHSSSQPSIRGRRQQKSSIHKDQMSISSVVKKDRWQEAEVLGLRNRISSGTSPVYSSQVGSRVESCSVDKSGDGILT